MAGQPPAVLKGNPGAAPNIVMIMVRTENNTSTDNNLSKISSTK